MNEIIPQDNYRGTEIDNRDNTCKPAEPLSRTNPLMHRPFECGKLILNIHGKE